MAAAGWTLSVVSRRTRPVPVRGEANTSTAIGTGCDSHPERGFPKDALEAADRCVVGVIDGAFEYRMAALSDDARGDVEEALAGQE